ncbi:MAG: hypothetical protein K9H61_01665 [Bacteroidia bacterium]|nr:hypothetical protein [Bacteroidia bacterium]MCF8425620.1 hypothetical protein [Bacteroidia bacterium]MCF8445677.1 hypothetical protein [Bacteroidia bacterium]
MANHYTENDLLLYLYKEMSEEDSKNLELALITDEKLQASLTNLKAGITALESLEEEPSQTTIELILEYSQKTSQKKLEEV